MVPVSEHLKRVEQSLKQEQARSSEQVLALNDVIESKYIILKKWFKHYNLAFNE